MVCRQFAKSISVAIFLFVTVQCYASSWLETFTTRSALEYESNPTMNPSNQEGGVWRMMLDPSYGITGYFDMTEISTGVALHAERTSNNMINQDRNDPSYFLNGRHRYEKGEFGLGARYEEASIRTAELSSVGLSYIDGTRSLRTVNSSWTHLLSMKSSFEMNGVYTNNRFLGGALVDFDSRTGVLIYRYTISDYSSPFIRLAYDDYIPNGTGMISHRYSYALGINWRSSELLQGGLQAGQYRIDNIENNIGYQGGMDLRYTGLNNQLIFNAERQVAATGLGGFTINDQANGSWINSINEKDSAGFDLGWRKSFFMSNSYSRSSGLWFQRELSFYWRTRIYLLNRTDSSDVLENVSTNIIGFNFNYTNPDL